MAAGLERLGEFEASGDVTTGANIATPGSASQQAVDERVAPVAGALIGALDPSIFEVPAEIAVDAKLAESNVLTADLESAATRSNRAAVSMEFKDSTLESRVTALVTALVPAKTQSTPVTRRADLPALGGDGKLSADVIPDKPLGVLTGLQVRGVVDGPVVLDVRADGTYVDGVKVVPGVGLAIKRVYVIANGPSQSNNESFAHPIVPMLDHESSRIWQLPYTGDALVPAVVPLSGPAFGSGLSPAHVLARKIVAADPEAAAVIVPVAVGGSGLITDPSGGRGKWEVGYTGPNPPLNANAKARVRVAIGQAQARWNLTPDVIATMILGETDAADGTLRAPFQTGVDSLVTDWQSEFNALFLIAGIVPGYEPVGTRPEITLALQDTPRRKRRVAYVPGPENGGGSRGPTDTNHYSREAAEWIGDEWFKAIPRAVNNVVGSSTQNPFRVSATRWGNTVTASWSPVQCLVTAYEVQSSTDGVTWTNVTMPEPVATRVEFTSSVPVKVRVRAIGTDTSNWTMPVNSVGG